MDNWTILMLVGVGSALLYEPTREQLLPFFARTAHRLLLAALVVFVTMVAIQYLARVPLIGPIQLP